MALILAAVAHCGVEIDRVRSDLHCHSIWRATYSTVHFVIAIAHEYSVIHFVGRGMWCTTIRVLTGQWNTGITWPIKMIIKRHHGMDKYRVGGGRQYRSLSYYKLRCWRPPPTRYVSIPWCRLLVIFIIFCLNCTEVMLIISFFICSIVDGTVGVFDWNGYGEWIAAAI